MPPGEPERQHVVSQVVLRRFADTATGLLRVYDLVQGIEQPLRPQAVAVVRRFIHREAARAESLWQETERRVPAVFAAVDNGTIFDEPELLDVLRGTIALHWARSKMLLAVIDQGWQRVRALRRQILLDDREGLASAFRDYFGLEPAGPEGLVLVADAIYERIEEQIRDDDFYGERVRDNFEQTRRLVRRQQIQIGTPERGEFLISDAPVVAWRAGHGGLGPLGGVPWDAADAILFPIGPGHCAALGSPGGWVEVPEAIVARLNTDQVRHAFRHVCYRPGSQLTNHVENVRAQILGVPPGSG